MPNRRVAIVGAGIAGLACARGLSEAGVEPTVFEKSRGLGGRCATRRTDAFHFDHGAQYFTVRDPEFVETVDAWRAEGAVAPWPGRFVHFGADGRSIAPAPESRWVGVPTMSAVGRHLGRGLEVRCRTRLGRLGQEAFGWRLHAEDGADLGAFDCVILAVPAPQALPFLDALPGLREHVASARLSPCWAALVGFDEPLGTDFDAARYDAGPLAWAARNASKPGRPAGEAWTLHASADWSTTNLEADASDVMPQLLEAFGQRVGKPLGRPAYATAHRWRYALATELAGKPFLLDAAAGIGLCGDWCLGPRVEAAWQSGTALARALLDGPCQL